MLESHLFIDFHVLLCGIIYLSFLALTLILLINKLKNIQKKYYSILITVVLDGNHFQNETIGQSETVLDFHKRKLL